MVGMTFIKDDFLRLQSEKDYDILLFDEKRFFISTNDLRGEVKWTYFTEVQEAKARQ